MGRPHKYGRGAGPKGSVKADGRLPPWRSPGIADLRPWLGRWNQTETEAGRARGRKGAAPCGDAEGLAIAEPASGAAQAETKRNHAKRSHKAGCAASGGVRVRHGAARSEPQALGPVVWGEGRSGGVRAETEGTGLNEATKPVCRSLRRQSGGFGSWHNVARHDGCALYCIRRDGRDKG